MRTKKLIPALLFFILCFTKKHLIAQTEGESFTIYLIRHSEKDLLSENQLDPPLTTCGIERSEHITSYFEDNIFAACKPVNIEISCSGEGPP